MNQTLERITSGQWWKVLADVTSGDLGQGFRELTGLALHPVTESVDVA